MAYVWSQPLTAGHSYGRNPGETLYYTMTDTVQCLTLSDDEPEGSA